MAKKAIAKDVIVKLIVGAGNASPSPPVGPALGSKEFNARTANYIVGTPIPARVIVRPDRSFHFELRTPPTAQLLMTAAGTKIVKNRVRGAGNVPGPLSGETKHGKGQLNNQSGNAGVGNVGSVTLKHVFEIAKIKQQESRLSGLTLEGLCRSVVAQANSVGIAVVP